MIKFSELLPHIPKFHNRLGSEEIPLQPIESEHSSEDSGVGMASSTAPSLESIYYSTSSIPRTFPEEESLPSTSSPFALGSVEHTPEYQNSQEILRRFIEKGNQSQKLKERLLKKLHPNDKSIADINKEFEKKFRAYVQSIKKNPQSPPSYSRGMQLLADKKEIFAVSEENLIKNPPSLSKSELSILRDLQAHLFEKILKTAHHQDTLEKYDWWALPRLLCLTIPQSERDILIETAADFQDILSQKHLSLPSLRYDLKKYDAVEAAADSSKLYHQIPRNTQDPSHKTRWETIVDSEFFHPLNETLEQLKENQAHVAAPLRKLGEDYVKKNPPFFKKKTNTTDRINHTANGSDSTNFERLKYKKYSSEYRSFSAMRVKLENMRENLFLKISKAFGELAKSSKSS